MLMTILSAIAAYVATSIDYFIIMLLFFATEKSVPRRIGFVAGHYLGMFSLYAISLLAAYGAGFIPAPWAIGLLGLVPIGLGIKAAFRKDDDAEERKTVNIADGRGGVIFAAILLTIAAGGDDLGVFIPMFASYAVLDIAVTIAIFIVCIGVLFFLSRALAEAAAVRDRIERYGRIVVPVVYIAIGVMVLIENGTLAALLGLF